MAARNKRKQIEEFQYRINFVGLRTTWRNPELSRSAKVILMDLLFYAGVDGISFPSQETLAINHGFTTSRHVKNLLIELKKHGLVGWDKGGFGVSNKYRFSKELYFPIEELNRKHSSSHTGNTLPPEQGTELPSKVVSEGNQISSSQLQQLFEEKNKEPISQIERRRFETLCKDYSPDLVEKAINKATNRGKTKFNSAYLSKIIVDLQTHGEAPPKPIFRACGRNGCESGYIYIQESNSMRECECNFLYDERLKNWKAEWGER